jgi:hypothetical protein
MNFAEVKGYQGHEDGEFKFGAAVTSGLNVDGL